MATCMSVSDAAWGLGNGGRSSEIESGGALKTATIGRRSAAGGGSRGLVVAGGRGGGGVEEVVGRGEVDVRGHQRRSRKPPEQDEDQPSEQAARQQAHQGS